MKTSERHHLKENDLARALGRAQVWLAANARALGLGAALVALLVVGTGAYIGWQAMVENRARTLLADAMVTYESRVMPLPSPTTADEPTVTGQMPGTFPSERARLDAALPKFLEAADAYPATDAGRTARFHAAAVLVQLARYDEAIAQYEQLLGGRDVPARMARLGTAEAELQAGRFDRAIAAYKAIVETADPRIPVEGVLMELARAYELAGNLDEARTTLTAIVDEHADSPFASDARQALEKLKVS
jgi:tetratricopeptide (TPR) repeat protein